MIFGRPCGLCGGTIKVGHASDCEFAAVPKDKLGQYEFQFRCVACGAIAASAGTCECGGKVGVWSGSLLPLGSEYGEDEPDKRDRDLACRQRVKDGITSVRARHPDRYDFGLMLTEIGDEFDEAIERYVETGRGLDAIQAQWKALLFSIDTSRAR